MKIDSVTLLGLGLLAAVTVPGWAAPLGPALPQPELASAATTGSPGAVAEAQRALPGNPLWAIPLARLKATRERPLFAPSRRPPPEVANPVPLVAAPARSAEPETPHLTLLGIMAGGREGIAMFVEESGKTFLRLRTGEHHNGWILREVQPRSVILEKGNTRSVLSLPTPTIDKPNVLPTPGPAPIVAAPRTVPRVPRRGS
jgi:general secretion pathway protein N